MNLLDVVIIGVAIAAAVGGYRLGFVTRVASWIGLGLGLVVAIRVLPAVLDRMRGSEPLVLLLVTLAVVFAGAFIGQGIGFVIGGRLRPRSAEGPVRRIDGVAGAIAGIAGVMVLVWLLLPVLAGASGYPAGAGHDVEDRGSSSTTASPTCPTASRPCDPSSARTTSRPCSTRWRRRRTWGRHPPPPASRPRPGLVSAARCSRSKASRAARCRTAPAGWSAWTWSSPTPTSWRASARPRSSETTAREQRRPSSPSTRNRDLAVLRVPGLDRAPLTIAASSKDATGGVFGHPGGGPLRVAPFAVARRITAVGRDIYGTGVTSRDVLELRASLRPGDSGSALVDAAGNVVGVAFAIAPDRAGVAYALSTAELDAVLQGNLVRAVDTGPCTGTA